MSKIFNPLHEISKQTREQRESFVSESAIFNTSVGICPKCGKQMTLAVIANNDKVYFCETDRVSTPLPNAEQ